MIQLNPVSVLGDNYVWILGAAGTSRVAVVDPGSAGPVLHWLHERDLEPFAVLLTHHHGDHVGGVEELVGIHPMPVYGPGSEQIGGVDRPLSDGDRVHLRHLDLELEVLHVPGHTAGHLAYASPALLLAGDTLFAGGCGRVFEGTSEQMYDSLCRLSALPGATAVYCAHEYTAANLSFAREVEPDNHDLEERFEEVRRLRDRGKPTLPSTLEVERRTNPFLRCDEPTVVAAAEARAGRSLKPGAEVFAVIRAWKDVWR